MSSDKINEKDFLRETYIEINLDNIEYNLKSIQNMCGPQVKIGAVIKADAYGHGAKQIADTLVQNGADLLCVATLSEAIELKRQNVNYPVLIMGLTSVSYMDYLFEYEIIQTIDHLEQARQLNIRAEYFGKPVHVHLKLDTGFHRLGFPISEESLTQIVQICQMPGLIVDGIFTHFVLLNEESNEKQLKCFLQVKSALEKKNIFIPCWHIADSIASVDYPESRLDMIRAGAILYGLKGFHKGSLPLRQALSFKTRINHISQIKAGEGVSYDFTWRANRDTKIATLPFGYADGYPRSLNGKGMVTLHGKRVPIVGIICMDQCMIDIGDVPEAKVGDEVIIYGDGTKNTLSIQEVSLLAGTNKNDLVSRLTKRPPRVYIKKEKMIAVRTMLDG